MTISRPFFQCYNQCIFSGGKGAGTLHSGVANHPQVLVSRWKKVVGLSTNEYTQKKALVITMYILLLCVCTDMHISMEINDKHISMENMQRNGKTR